MFRDEMDGVLIPVDISVTQLTPALFIYLFHGVLITVGILIFFKPNHGHISPAVMEGRFCGALLFLLQLKR